MSRASKPAKQNGTSSAEIIRASGHDRANRPYTRLHPDQARQTLTDPLQRGSHPHRTVGFRPTSDVEDVEAESMQSPQRLDAAPNKGSWNGRSRVLKRTLLTELAPLRAVAVRMLTRGGRR